MRSHQVWNKWRNTWSQTVKQGDNARKTAESCLPSFMSQSRKSCDSSKEAEPKRGFRRPSLLLGENSEVFVWLYVNVCAWVFGLQRLGSRPVLKHTHKTERVTTQTHSVSICVSDSFINNTSFFSPAAQLVWRRIRTRTAGSADISRVWGTHARSHTNTDAQTSAHKVKEKQLLVQRG